MKKFYIKDEFIDEWGNQCDEYTVVTSEAVENLANEWEVPVGDLLDQLIEVGEPQWFVVDDAISTSGQIFDRALGTTDAEKAMRDALGEWNCLTDMEKRHRDDFYIAFGEPDRYGHLDMETVSKTVDIMKLS